MISQDLDEGNGELPHELNAILESIEAKPIGTELEDGEPWSEKDKNQNNVSLKSITFYPKLWEHPFSYCYFRIPEEKFEFNIWKSLIMYP